MQNQSVLGRDQKEQARINLIIERLEERFPAAQCALKHQDPFQLLVATILSAQCTDERVNKVTPVLFARHPNPQSLATADSSRLEEIIRTTGFFRNKARNLIGACRKIVESFDGKVPQTMEQLLELPGVARKTANVVLGTGFGIASGVVVDTHVGRIAKRLALTDHANPVEIEKDLMERITREHWISFSHRLIYHGRQICKARRPRCEECFLTDLCPFPEAG